MTKRGGKFMKKLDLNDIKIKVSEVKALFLLGQKIIPVLEEIFQFVYEIQPLFDEINESIQETTSKVPKAADKIINISNATEMATSEILDYVDEIFKSLEKLSKQFKQQVEEQKPIYKELLEQIKMLRSNEGYVELADNMLMSLQKLYKITIGKKAIEDYSKEYEKLNILTNKILMALQFQDITSQQLQAANHVISQVQKRLGELMQRLGNMTPEDLQIQEFDESTFNENAEFTSMEERQKLVDEIEATFDAEQGLSQEEIDRLAREAMQENSMNEEDKPAGDSENE